MTAGGENQQSDLRVTNLITTLILVLQHSIEMRFDIK